VALFLRFLVAPPCIHPLSGVGNSRWPDAPLGEFSHSFYLQEYMGLAITDVLLLLLLLLLCSRTLKHKEWD